MKTILRTLTAAAALALATGSSSAADVTGSTGYDWTGAYLGVHGGYAWGEADIGYEVTTAAETSTGSGAAPWPAIISRRRI